jgi:Rod binding domain-containing protein
MQIPATGTASPGLQGSGAAVDPRLRPAAREFEASMMKELLEPMQHDALFSDEDGTASDGGMDTLASLRSQSLAEAIANHGGFGIANRVLEQIGQQQRAGHSHSGQNREKG